MYDDDEGPVDEPFRSLTLRAQMPTTGGRMHGGLPLRKSFRGGVPRLICGLILLVFIVCILTWAYLEDLREARELEEVEIFLDR